MSARTRICVRDGSPSRYVDPSLCRITRTDVSPVQQLVRRLVAHGFTDVQLWYPDGGQRRVDCARWEASGRKDGKTWGITSWDGTVTICARRGFTLEYDPNPREARGFLAKVTGD